MVQRLVGWAWRSGVRKGVVGGSSPWLVIAVAAGAVRLLSRPARARDAVTLSLRPGERYSIVCGEDPPRSR
jgi:hypothetical protein